MEIAAAGKQQGSRHACTVFPVSLTFLNNKIIFTLEIKNEKINRSDALHIAIATVSGVDVLVSWNFKHIVNLNRIKLFNSVNLKEGYHLLEIRTPLEVI